MNMASNKRLVIFGALAMGAVGIAYIGFAWINAHNNSANAVIAENSVPAVIVSGNELHGIYSEYFAAMPEVWRSTLIQTSAQRQDPVYNALFLNGIGLAYMERVGQEKIAPLLEMLEQYEVERLDELQISEVLLARVQISLVGIASVWAAHGPLLDIQERVEITAQDALSSEDQGIRQAAATLLLVILEHPQSSGLSTPAKVALHATFEDQEVERIATISKDGVFSRFGVQ